MPIMSRLKLYYDLMSQPSRAVVMFCKLANIPYQDHPVALRKGEHRSDKYLAEVNPFGLVPAINKDGFRLTESVAILRFLCREYPVADHWYPKDSQAQARVDEYLEWQHANTRLQCAMYFQTKWLIPMMTGEPVNEKRMKNFQAGMERVLDQLETVWLKETPYIAGQTITVADVLAACELEQPTMVAYDVTAGRPRLAAWLERVRTDCQPHYEQVHTMCRRIRDKFGGATEAKL
ncbi:glutathione S-transferase theta-1-like isoform X2 [Pollicipes pollicipes]|nr:glutathione S-transferase theta-1-like isoform X1 [Pollicipes pollicipes]XP_037077524.1 glutathione S-transferase theta-1-like isoform X2 [Pollicipes pollicipes]